MIRILVVLLAVASLVNAQSQSKLIFVQQVFRHGARYPIFTSTKDKSDFAVQQHSVGQLTSQGKAMHYMLGKMLYKDYWNKLFNDNNVYNQSKFYFKSTDVNRTIESIQSQLQGIFENIQPVNISNRDLINSLPAWNYTLDRDPGFVFSTAPTLHPMPIHVEKGFISPWDKGDFLRTYSSQICYKQKDWIEQNKQNAFVKKITSHPNFVAAVAEVNKALKTNLTFFDVYRYFDNSQCMKHLDIEPLPIFRRENQTFKDLQAIYILDAYIKMFYTEQQLSATATGYFNETVNNFKKVVKDQTGVQWAFYSAHDTTIMNFLSRLGLANAQCIYLNYLNGTTTNDKSQYCIVQYPTYTSSIIFEVYQYNDGSNTFKIRYNGNYRRIPFCKWQYECGVEKMYSWYDSWKDEDFVKTCGIKDDESSTYYSIMMLELAVILVFIVIFVKQYLDKPKPDMTRRPRIKKSQEEYQAPRPQAGKMIKQTLLSQEDNA